MANTSAPRSSIYNGWFDNAVDGRLDLYVNGTLVEKRSTTTTEVDAILDVDGAVNFAAEVEFAANAHFQSTIEAGADGVGADGEQLTSGGAGVATDWSASGV